MGRKRFGVIGALVAAMSFGVQAAQADTVRVSSTTDTVDAGLYDNLIKTAYAAAFPGDNLVYTAVGTGQALKDARGGLADVVVTHAPTAEAQFVTDGFSVEPYGRAIFYSDYVIIGPPSDPAGIFTNTPHDAVGAFERIAAAGEAGQANFVSRADASGTNTQEQIQWGLTTTVAKQHATTLAAGATQYEPQGPGGAGTFPSWYQRGGTGTGQAKGMDLASVCNYPNGNCYTLTDRGTYNNRINQGLDTNLKILTDKNLSTARGGQNLLVNPFSVYIVNPDTFDDAHKPNVAAGTRFADFLTSASFQDAVLGYPTAADPAFFSDAFPKVSGTAPTTAAIGGTVPLSFTFTDKLPGAAAISGLPVQLQASTDGGKTFTDAGAPVVADAAGTATFSPAISVTTTYRVSLPRYKKFSPFTANVGTVAVPVATTPTPAATPAPVVDKTPPVASKFALAARSFTFTFTSSEAGTARVTIARKVVKTKKRGKKVTKVTSYSVVKNVVVALKPGSITIKSSTLVAGTYKVTVTAADAAGNRSTRTALLVVKAAKQAAR